ncbi:MAG: AsmA family protein [Alphaproteobacteria bacterium]|nr:AsmA family protein [Alphaproteobacteria bacterium]
MKRALKILGAVLALLVVVAIAIPMFISADYLKAQLQDQVEKATGRTLTINGKASLSLFPALAVTVEDVTLGNPAGFAAPYLVHVDKLAAGAALKPLLAKELRITGITLDGATLYLEANARGAKNWEFSPAAKAAGSTDEAARGAAPAEKKAASLKALAIGRVTVRNTVVHYAKAGEEPIAAEDINLTVDGADGKAPLALDGGITYRKQAVGLKLTVATLQALMTEKPAVVRASLTLPTGAANFEGTLALKDGPQAQGKASFNSDNLGSLLGWATGKEPSGALPKKVSVQSTIGMKGAQHITLDALAFSADALSGTGALTVNLAGAVPALSGNLKLGAVDLGAFAGKAKAATPVAGTAASASSASAGDDWSDAPLDMSGLRAVNANLKLAIEKLISGKFVVSDIVAEVAMNGGNAKLTLAHLALYGGTAKGTVGLDGSTATTAIATNLALSHMDIEALMTALSGASKMKGTAQMTLAATGRGTSQRALVGSLGGNGTVRINDGAIKGINVASFLRDAKKGFILGSAGSESTDFTELTASYTIAQGVVSNSDLLMKSPVLRLVGSGTISLPSRSIDYRAVPTIVGTLKGQGGKDTLSGGGLEIPLIIRGPWRAISVTPDFAAAAASALKDPAAFKQNLKDIGNDLRKFNSPKDIGAALFGDKKAKTPAAETAPAPAPATPVTSPAPVSAPAPATQAAPAPAPVPSKEQQIQDAIGGVLGAFGK